MITKLPINDWQQPLSAELCDAAIEQLENGQVLLFDPLVFALTADERKFLTPYCIEQGRKNISYDVNNNSIKGVNPNIARATTTIQSMMQRYVTHTQSLLARLLTPYQSTWKIGRTSFRPVEILSREPLSPHKDDRLLHVDAFPTTPVAGKRILRFFTNINPHQAPRRWRTGESFTDVANRFIPEIQRPLPFARKIKQTLKITRGYQTLYDYYMLKLHNTMKADAEYQQKFAGTYDFPAGASWLVYTDLVSHAAISGQFLLEQTFYLPIDAMKTPTRSPLRILEEFLQKALV
jgi:hypothetical protein